MKKTLCSIILATAIPVLAQLGADNKPIAPPPPPVDPYPTCGQAFHNKYVNSLNGKQRAYMQKITDIMYDKADLDGEGTEDIIDIQSRPAVEPCEMTQEWYEKRNTVRIRYDADHDWQQEFIGGLVSKMSLFPGKQQIQVVMQDYEGKERKLTFHYDLPEGRK